jgi:protein-tyrosine phosphatase
MSQELELISEILPNLYMGGTDDNDIVRFPKRLRNLNEREEFDAVVTCYSYAQPMSWYVHENRFGFADGPINEATFAKALELADWIYEKWQDGAKCLIRCQMGYNRSGLVTAAVLMKTGLSAMAAVDLIREKRSPFAMSNTDFVRRLEEYSPSLS